MRKEFKNRLNQRLRRRRFDEDASAEGQVASGERFVIADCEQSVSRQQ
jgi:hypothetical protein